MMDSALIRGGGAVAFDADQPDGVDGQVIVEIGEVCRHLEIHESTRTITGMLAKHVPIGQVLVRRIDRERSFLDTIAVGLPLPDYLLPEARTQCSEGQLAELLAWCKVGEVARRVNERSDGGPLAVVSRRASTATCLPLRWDRWRSRRACWS